MVEIQTFTTHLECSETGKHYPADQLHNLSDTGKPLLVRYDLASLREAVNKDDLAAKLEGGFWRYREFLPVRQETNVMRLGEVTTPIIPLETTSQDLNVETILVKDEGRLPTGSFKARGLALAVSMAREFDVKRIAMPTNGNAGAALAAYCSLAGIESYVFCPDDTPDVNAREIELQGAKTFLVNGLINDCGRIVGEGQEPGGWFDCSTLKEPYRIEGKKTMGIELAEQLGWTLPDVIFYPTGGGTGLIGMWKAFDELEAIGFIGSNRPKMVAVQASGCAPIVRAWEQGAEHASPWENAQTYAAGIRVPVAIGDFLILRAIRESHGFAIAVDDELIEQARTEIAHSDGLLLCPEGAATFAAYKQALKNGQVDRSDKCVLFNCATGLKYPMPQVERSLNINQEIDYNGILGH